MGSWQHERGSRFDSWLAVVVKSEVVWRYHLTMWWTKTPQGVGVLGSRLWTAMHSPSRQCSALHHEASSPAEGCWPTIKHQAPQGARFRSRDHWAQSLRCEVHSSRPQDPGAWGHGTETPSQSPIAANPNPSSPKGAGFKHCTAQPKAVHCYA